MCDKFKNLIIQEYRVRKNLISGPLKFSEIEKLNFEGVYVICKDQKIVYIGSSYARTIDERLGQYLTRSKSGNTLAKHVFESKETVKKFDDIELEDFSPIIDEIKTFKIYAIKYEDLEYKLIKGIKPEYNIKGK